MFARIKSELVSVNTYSLIYTKSPVNSGDREKGLMMEGRLLEERLWGRTE